MYVCAWMFSLHVYLGTMNVQCPWSPEEGFRSPGTELEMWVLETELGPSARAQPLSHL